MEIKRNLYLNRLVSYMWDGQVKVITGIRRCGKSYLLRTLFRNYLLSQGVDTNHILSFELDLAKDIRYRNPLELAKTVREQVSEQSEQYYLLSMKFRCQTKCRTHIIPTASLSHSTMHSMISNLFRTSIFM